MDQFDAAIKDNLKWFRNNTFCPNLQCGAGLTALMYASELGHIKIVIELIRAGADINLQSTKGHTALMYASSRGYKDVVVELIRSGADPNLKKSDGDTPLTEASNRGYKEVVVELIRAGADPNLRCVNKSTATIQAAYNNRHEVVVELIRAGADLNVTDDCGYTALTCASDQGHKEIVVELIRAGADVNVHFGNITTALIRSLERNCTTIAMKLIAAGAFTDFKNENGCVALMFCARCVAYEKFMLLYPYLKSNARDKFNRSAINYAIEYANCPDKIKFLLSQGQYPCLNPLDNELDSATHKISDCQALKLWDQTPRSLKFFTQSAVETSDTPTLLVRNDYDKEIKI